MRSWLPLGWLLPDSCQQLPESETQGGECATSTILSHLVGLLIVAAGVGLKWPFVWQLLQSAARAPSIAVAQSLPSMVATLTRLPPHQRRLPAIPQALSSAFSALRPASPPTADRSPPPAPPTANSGTRFPAYPNLLLPSRTLSPGSSSSNNSNAPLLPTVDVDRRTSDTTGQLLARNIQVRFYLLEMVSLLLTCAYSYRFRVPFSAYGEAPILLAQDWLILALALYVRGMLAHLAVIYIGLSVGVWYLLFEAEEKRLHHLMALQLPLLLAIQLPTLYRNHRHKHTLGFTWEMTVLGLLMGMGRVFTTYVDVSQDDWVILGGALLGPLLQAVLLLQVHAYRQETHLRMQGQQLPLPKSY